jgi:anti-anti-sigma factor
MPDSIQLIRVNGIIGNAEYVSLDLNHGGIKTEVTRYPFDPQAVPTDLTDIIQAGIERGRTNVILDMGNIPWINSKGLGTLVMLFHTVKRHGGALVLARPVPDVAQSIETVHLDKILQVFPSVAEAVKYLMSQARSAAAGG